MGRMKWIEERFGVRQVGGFFDNGEMKKKLLSVWRVEARKCSDTRFVVRKKSK